MQNTIPTIYETPEEYRQKIEMLKASLADADAILIGAGAGLSTAAGFTYSGERFETYFADFRERYGITDMYSGGFYPFKTHEEYWAWWSRHIFYNRYVEAPKPVYRDVFDLVKNADYFVLTIISFKKRALIRRGSFTRRATTASGNVPNRAMPPRMTTRPWYGKCLSGNGICAFRLTLCPIVPAAESR